MESKEIRRRFVEFYKARGYSQLPRAPMLDDSIPMSFVMSAGLVQVEQSLANQNIRDKDSYVLVQDCFRHFDLDKVGTDDFHLSLFEMPGAFKFGPDGKVATVERMWQLATSVFGIEEDHLWASYFGGGQVLSNQLPPDMIVRQAWMDVGLPSKRIVDLGVNGNYWLQGKGIDGDDTTRKSGPNTELFYDRGEALSCGFGCQPGCKCGRFVEFSNSLFIRYELDEQTGLFTPMNEPFSETVIGTERVAMILQRGQSVFEISIYQPLINQIHEFVKPNGLDDILVTVSERVIADHIRALYLLVADGAPPPGKNGRERIIKLLIRGIVTRQILLGITDQNFFLFVLEFITNTLSSDKNSLIQERVIEYFVIERERFLKTIERGQRKLSKKLDENNGQTLSGQQMIDLEKKMGLPSEIIKKFLMDRGLDFLSSEYNDALGLWKQDPVTK